MGRPRLCIVSEALARSHDEGIKNLARAFVQQGLRRYDILGLSTREAIPEWQTEAFCGNKLFVNPALWRRIRRFAPQAILYIPWTSATSASIARAWVLGRACGAPVALVATQPQPYRSIERPLVRWLRPALTFVQGPENGRNLAALGHRVAFLPSGVDLAAFTPVNGQRRAAARSALGLDPASWILTHVGHLNRYRVNIELYRALQAIPGVQTVVVGSVDQPQDQELIAELEAAGVHIICSYLERVSQVYEASDCYLFPVQRTTSAIGVPLSVLEAMACNIPVVTIPFEGLKEMFPAAGEGLVFARNDDEIVTAVRRLAADGAGPCTPRLLVEPYDWSAVVDRALQELLPF